MAEVKTLSTGGLTQKQRAFSREFLVDFHGTAAAIRAGYAKRSAHVAATRLLKDAKIQTLICETRDRVLDKVELRAEDVVQELMVVAFSSMGDFVTIRDNGTVVLDFTDLPVEAMRAVAEITQEEYLDGRGEDARPVRKSKFKLHNKLRALDLLGRYLNLFSDADRRTVDGGEQVTLEAQNQLESDLIDRIIAISKVDLTLADVRAEKSARVIDHGTLKSD